MIIYFRRFTTTQVASQLWSTAAEDGRIKLTRNKEKAMRPLPQICWTSDYVLPTDLQALSDTVVIESVNVSKYRIKHAIECAQAALKPGGTILILTVEQQYLPWSYALEDRGLEIKDCLCVATQSSITNLVIVATRPCEKTYFENAVKHKVAGFWIDGSRVGNKVSGWNGLTAKGNTWNAQNCGLRKTGQATMARGKFPSNFILAEQHKALQDYFHVLANESDLLAFLCKLTKTPYGGLVVHIAATTPLLYQAAISADRKYIGIVERQEQVQDLERLCHGND